MKKRMCAILLVLCILMTASGCSQESAAKPTVEPTSEIPTEPPLPDAQALFAEAIEKLEAAELLTVSATGKEEHTVWGETYVQKLESEMTVEGKNDEMLCKVETELEFNGDAEFEMTEFYVDGHCYATFDDAKYREKTDSEKFLAGQYPIRLFDGASFSEAVAEETEDGTLLTFTEATALESWVAPEYAVLTSAQATALLSDGAIKEMSYTASFRQGAADILIEVETELRENRTAVLKMEVPEDHKDYIDISYVALPAVIERVTANLKKSESRSAQIAQTITSQAAAAAVINSETVHEYKMNRDYLALTDTNMMLYSSDGEESYEMKEVYRDGNYTYIVDGEEQQSQELPRGYMEIGMEAMFTDYIMPGTALTTAEVTDFGEGMLIEFTSEDEAFAKQLKTMTMSEIFGENTTVDDLATAYKPQEIKGYFGIDKDTWLPISYSVDFSGVHTIEGEDYTLSQQLYASLTPSDPEAYESITEEKLPEEKPEQPASPLFYHVTGNDGSEMWLLGTIHIGDERTAYLPKEIYDAFDASDALAVEFNMNKYAEDMENNTQTQESIAEMYFYTDGTTAKDHLDSEVYEDAVKMLKYTGDYHSNMEMAKISIWEMILTNAQSDLGRRLSADKGVDQRLLDRAEEQEKEILDVESAEAQMEMLTGFSDELQQLLLTTAMDYSRNEYNQSVWELYELWCSGDEAALIEYLNDDEEETAEMTEEEKKLYEEYEKAMSTDRDIDMIEVAKGYLTGGKTVFYAVGLAHLLKENGLVDGLRAAGYQVELVSFAPTK